MLELRTLLISWFLSDVLPYRVPIPTVRLLFAAKIDTRLMGLSIPRIY